MRSTVYWEPENRAFWAREGARIAQRNLVVSSAALAVAFAVWMVWSVVVVYLPRIGFHFSANQLFWLAAAPGLAGAVLRLFFVFMVPIFGGRTWTTVSTLALLVPVIGLGIAVQDPHTSYPTFLMLALAAGIGGGNFASSVCNISMLYPGDRRGTALGLNAGVGNLGVCIAQLVVPAAVGVSLFGMLGGAPQQAVTDAANQSLWVQNAGYVWVVPILVVAGLAWLNMSDVETEGSFAEQSVVFVRRHTWLLAWLYLGTFGSYAGFAAAFPLLAEREFDGAVSPMLAFLGPLLAAGARPVGGWLADRRGGARVALGAFLILAATMLAMIAVGETAAARTDYSPFLALFAVLFIASGVGNGAVFQLIPAVFVAERHAALAHEPQGGERALREGSLEGAAALGLASGIAAFGGFFIPKAYGTAAQFAGGERFALYAFLLFYATCVVVTWWCYVRGGAFSIHTLRGTR
jgi:NNP family nitrate/nitrite transporter-like MFS transporter